ncbi:hypothetical protein PTTG_02711 [Puccinia triticina 1-1 BBBD Race 1]|uniref:Smr domain-containing protein n=2 Tax=Puccinia triticina TaxID=208348 RepID=A0A180GJG3_PUCT1|nr:uncharacterized protein PtA15_6A670 [Puccinia triticina]OAV92927.1 hypothetical protein PTTG_02711 [Puccinia triticina 1-1 BBBD Race 1]WAQ86040.1 hypothetical protein PtA15_6A670 [Puccinia triticina]WAR55935.1 hypothetical protein PtB15_6B679 [Puccinia triticina]
MGGTQEPGCSFWPTSADRRDTLVGSSPVRLSASGDDPIPHLTDAVILFLETNNQKNARDPHFVSLRNQALEEGKLMEQKFKEARLASQHGQAKSLREQANRHKQQQEKLNKQAADWLFKENNHNLPADTIDLHGLYVKESLTYAEKFIQRAEKNGRPDRLQFIVGKGLHSVNSKPLLKPAIEGLIRKHKLAFEEHPRNPGILVVQLNVPGDHVGRGINILDRISCNPDSKEGCLIV